MQIEELPIKQTRNAAATRERVLNAALAEFGSRGYGGGRIAEISAAAKCNIRMVYHYFGSKEELYIACLEHVYHNIRHEEQQLNLSALEPAEAIRQLVEFTFEHMKNNPHFVHLAGVENTQRGEYIKNIPSLVNAATDLIETIGDILKRGAEQGTFKQDIDAFQLYISILSLSYLHLSNRYTLSITYGREMDDVQWLAERRTHITDVILSYVTQPPREARSQCPEK